jgi:predicted enzyme related to lactoylglutathione lyase
MPSFLAMPQFTHHQPGTFSWPELATTDQAAALAFYSALFGWTVNEQPVGPDASYSIFQMDGADVGAAYTMRPEEHDLGGPHWNAYVTVANVEQTTTRARALGATVLAPPFDVYDAGRMAILQDPSGALFQVWQAGRSIGAGVLAEPGALCWTELTTTDPDAAEAFYSSLFGWTPKHAAPGSPVRYTEFTVPGATLPSIGIMQKPPHLPPHMPSFWLPYFQVLNVDAAVASATALGAQVHFGPESIADGGRFAVLADPQGAAFAVFAPSR